MMARTRLVIVEDHPLVAQGLAALLEPEFEIGAVVHDARRVVVTLEASAPAAVLLDLSMPHRNGLELLPDIRKAFPSMRILVVTMHLDRSMAERAFKAGADGFVPKEASAGELKSAIHSILRGERHLSPRVPKRAYRDDAVLENPLLDRLTPRQLEILRRIGEGRSGVEIAADMGLSPRTLEYHRASLRRKLGIATETGLMRFAVEAGLVDPDAESPVGG